MPYFTDESVTLHHGDALAVLQEMADQSIDSCVTSPPYFGLRDYGMAGQYGLETSPVEYVETMGAVFAEVRRVLVKDGTLWLNLGDSFAAKARGSDAGWDKSRLTNPAQQQKVQAAALRDTGERHRGAGAGIGEKNLLGMPWRVAFALQEAGWTLRSDIIWHKPNAMPESVTDRPSTRYEHVFLFSRAPRYWFDLDSIREPLSHPDKADGSIMFGGRNKGSDAGIGARAHRRGANTYSANDSGGRNPGDVWSIPTQPFTEAHFAAMPTVLAERCVLAGCKPGGVVLDPFSGSGTTGLAATKHGRRYVGIDINAEYLDLSLRTRLAQVALADEVGA
jgi:DNA modification methylase